MEENKQVEKKECNLAARVELTIKALGTMVIMPIEESDPNEIGKKVVKGNIQRPILEGIDRERVKNKLVELLTSD